MNENRGVTGTLEILFALPTDDPTKWRMSGGKLSFRNGAVTDLDVKGGHVPYFRSSEGLTATYYVFSNIKQDNGRLTGDVVMTTCISGRVIVTNDIAFGVEVIPVPEIAAPIVGTSQNPADLVPS
jgi:hypothetical protein